MSDLLYCLICVFLIPLRAALTPIVISWELIGMALEATGKYKCDFEVRDISITGRK